MLFIPNAKVVMLSPGETWDGKTQDGTQAFLRVSRWDSNGIHVVLANNGEGHVGELIGGGFYTAINTESGLELTEETL